mmetsp:Transcript_20813/g.43420  ORF Transcript_20813/g.43420 Transcript_20813/m.43420 type:complete len:393 (+) Transcript_20813:131-1309(+)
MPSSTSTTELVIDGLALLKIITHSHNHLPTSVTGSLLGLSTLPNDPKSTVYVSNSFGFPNTASSSAPQNLSEAGEGGDDEAGDDVAGDDAAVQDVTADLETDVTNDESLSRIVASNQEQEKYQLEMMKLLRATNVDTSVVGWYMSTYLGTFASTSLIETQLSYQLELGDRAVVLLYDPIQTANNSGGDVVVKAYTLTKQFVEVKKRGGKEFVHSKNVFNEMTVKVRNPGLVRAALFDLDRQNAPPSAGPSVPRTVLTNSKYGDNGDVDFGRLDLSTNPFLEKNIEFLCQWVDDLTAEHGKMQLYARTLLKEEGGGTVQPIGQRNNRAPPRVYVDKKQRWEEPAAPSRVDAILSNMQLKAYCNNINDFTERSVSKLFLASGLQGGGLGGAGRS